MQRVALVDVGHFGVFREVSVQWVALCGCGTVSWFWGLSVQRVALCGCGTFWGVWDSECAAGGFVVVVGQFGGLGD